MRAQNLVIKAGWRYGRAPAFVVVGTGRSGTTFVADVLAACGVCCGHERYFRPEGYRRRWERCGEVSWTAVPWLERGTQAGPVYHVVRHPLDVVTSLLTIGFFSDAAPGPFRSFARAHFRLTGDEHVDAMRWYVEWNRRCEALARVRFRIEDPADGLGVLLGEVAPQAVPRLPAALDAVPTSTNTRSRGNRLGWDDLPDAPERAALAAMGRRYGYAD